MLERVVEQACVDERTLLLYCSGNARWWDYFPLFARPLRQPVSFSPLYFKPPHATNTVLRTLEVLHVDLLTGHSELLFRPPPSLDLPTLSNIKEYPASLSGDFFSVGVALGRGTAVLLVNWRETTYILFQPSPSWTVRLLHRPLALHANCYWT